MNKSPNLSIMIPDNFSKLLLVILLSFTLPSFGAKKERINKVTFEVQMLCESHVEKIQQCFLQEKAIKSVEIILSDKIIKVSYDRKMITKSDLIYQIEKLGLSDVICINENTAENDCGCDDGCNRGK